MTKKYKIDRFDRLILNLVQSNNRLTTESISEQVGLSAAAVQRRLKILREKKVIINDISILNQDRVGKPMTFIVQISLEREHINLFDDFKQRMKENPQVQQCYYVTGDSDFVIIVTASDMQEYERFTKDFFFGDSNIKHFHTNVVMSRVKTGQKIDLEEML